MDGFETLRYEDAGKVIVLAADGPHFSSGHDLRDRASVDDFSPVSTFGGFSKPGAEGRQAVEEELRPGRRVPVDGPAASEAVAPSRASASVLRLFPSFDHVPLSRG